MVDPYTCTSLVPLGCVCFGFKSLLEILFCKCGCLFAYEKWIFRKRILVDRKIKAFDPESIFNQNFTFKSFPKTHKERERERSRTQKVEIVAPLARSSWRDRQRINPRTHEQRTHEPTNGEPTTRERRTHDRTANPRTASHTAPIAPTSRTVTDLALVLVTGESHRYRSRSCDFDFLLSLFDL